MLLRKVTGGPKKAETCAVGRLNQSLKSYRMAAGDKNVPHQAARLFLQAI